MSWPCVDKVAEQKGLRFSRNVSYFGSFHSPYLLVDTVYARPEAMDR